MSFCFVAVGEIYCEKVVSIFMHRTSQLKLVFYYCSPFFHRSYAELFTSFANDVTGGGGGGGEREREMRNS